MSCLSRDDLSKILAALDEATSCGKHDRTTLRVCTNCLSSYCFICSPGSCQCDNDT